MANSGLFDLNNNPLSQGQHYLFTIPDDAFESRNHMFYASNLGKEMNTMSAKYMLVYIIPTNFLIINLASCLLKEDMTPLTISEHEILDKKDAKYFAYEGIDLNTVDKTSPYVEFSEDNFIFCKYLLSRNWLLFEPNPVIDLSNFQPPSRISI
jgi:hypothetical protein